MSTGHVEYASLNGTHIFKLIGEVRAQSCISLDKLLNKLEQQDNVVGAIVDLTETSFIDSTVLGVLAKLGLKLKQLHKIQAVMLSTNSDITTLANSMGLGQVFVILDYCGDSNVCTRKLMEEHADASGNAENCSGCTQDFNAVKSEQPGICLSPWSNSCKKNKII